MDRKAQFSVRRNAALFGIVALASGGLAAAFLIRGHGLLDAVLGVVLAAIAAVHLFAFVGARQPLLLADESAVRLRVGAGWQPVPWSAIRQVVVERPDSVLRDGRIVVEARDPGVLSDHGLLGRIHSVWSTRWYGAPLSVPLALSTTTSGEQVAEELREIAAGRAEVVELRGRHLANLEEHHGRVATLVSRVVHHRDHDGHPDGDSNGDFDWAEGDAEAIDDSPEAVQEWLSKLNRAWNKGVDRLRPTEEPEATVPVLPEADLVSPLRDPVLPTRVEVRRDVPASPGQLVAEAGVPATAPRAEAAQVRFDDVAAASIPAPGPTPEPAPGVVPVIGPVLREARERVRLSIDELSERTRIRPHVLEAIERDDFGPCGGDFYARGHLTTLARALAVDLEPLMRHYEERYAHGPINARRVFEAELATGLGGGMRATVGGPKWSLLIATVLCLVMVWGVARLFSDPPEMVAAPDGDHTAGLAANREPIVSPKMKLKTMTVKASFASAHVVVKDRTGKVLWSGDLAQGEHRKVAGLAPFTVSSDNGGAVEVTVLGKAQGTLGTAGVPGSRKLG